MEFYIPYFQLQIENPIEKFIGRAWNFVLTIIREKYLVIFNYKFINVFETQRKNELVSHVPINFRTFAKSCLTKSYFMIYFVKLIKIMNNYISLITAWKVSQYRPEKIPYLNIFHAVNCYFLWRSIVSGGSQLMVKRILKVKAQIFSIQ